MCEAVHLLALPTHVAAAVQAAWPFRRMWPLLCKLPGVPPVCAALL